MGRHASYLLTPPHEGSMSEGHADRLYAAIGGSLPHVEIVVNWFEELKAWVGGQN